MLTFKLIYGPQRKKSKYPTSNNWNIQWSTRKMDKLKSIMTQMLALQKQQQELQLQLQKSQYEQQQKTKKTRIAITQQYTDQLEHQS